MQQLSFQLARQTDDSAIRQLLQENPMGGDISLSLEREPSYFDFSGVEGDFHQAIIAREQKSKKVVGFASRAIRKYYINGTLQDLGYIGQLRFTPAHRRFFPLLKGFQFLKELHKDKRVPFYLTSIMEDNITTARVLLSGVPQLPRYEEYCRFVSHSISTRNKKNRCKPLPDNIHIENGSPQRFTELVAFLRCHNKSMQFAPVWDEESLLQQGQTPGLSHNDFFLAIDKNKIVGCLALWDQRQFKQAVIRSYSPRIARWRWLINVIALISGSPRLPSVNSTIPHCYLSHISIKEQNKKIFAALLNAVMKEAKQRKIPLLTIGFATTHPLNIFLESSYKTFRNYSRIFLVSWDDAEAPPPLQSLDTRTPGIEVALL
jgi:hypothetical protein